MIPKKAVKNFLQQPRADYRKAKRWSAADLQTKRERLPIKPPIWHKLRQHQKTCFLLGAELHRFAYHLDTGMGKSLVAIALARYLRRLGVLKHKVMILVPAKANKGEWAREITKHSPNTTYCILKGSSAHKWEQIQNTKAHLIVETYAGLTRMVCERKKKKHRDGSITIKLRPLPRLVKRLQTLVDGLVLDESTFVGNHSSLIFRVCRQLSKSVKMLFALTGTPFGRDPTPLWAQMFLVDQGATLGKTLGLFRQAFFAERETGWATEYVFKPSKRGLLHRILAHRSIRFEPREGDLPKVVSIIKDARLPQDTRTYATSAHQALLDARGNFRETTNLFLRMRQISSGFLGYYDDEMGKRAQLEFNPNPKLEMLMALVQSIRPDRKIIIFHEFIFSGDMICRELTKIEVSHVRLYGGTKNPEEVLKQFTRVDVVHKVDNKGIRTSTTRHLPGRSPQVLVLNHAAGGFGLNLQIAKYGIYFESPVSPIMRRQTEARFERQESPHDKVFKIDLVMRGTYDQRILNFLAEGKDLFRAIIKGEKPPPPPKLHLALDSKRR